MSGGSWDYICYKLDDVADQLCDSGKADRVALGRHMKKIAHAMHEIEWVDSCDSSPPADSKAIAEVFGDLYHAKTCRVLMENIRDQLDRMIAND